MISKTAKLGSILCVAAIALPGHPAGAGNLNTSGTVCQSFNGSEALDIDYVLTGVRNLNASPRAVICALPRSPLAGTAPGFYVDGLNVGPNATTCTLSVYTYQGILTTSTTFTEPAAPGPAVKWDHLVTLPVGSVGTFDYVSLMCTLPGSGNAVLYGATAVQP